MNDLPLAFFHLGLDSEKYFMSDDRSFRGPCIQCGGSRRMVTFINGAFPNWFMVCDLCGLRGWVWQFFNLSKHIDGEMEVDTLEGKIDKLNQQTDRLSRFIDGREWEKYAQEMGPEHKQWWEYSGVPVDWQRFWQVGYAQEHAFAFRGEVFLRSAYTMPKFDMGFLPVNMDYRIIDPPLGVGKYRPIYGLPSRVYIARPDFKELAPDGRLVIVEGAKKAMVLACRLGVQVIGLPGSRSWLDLLPKVLDARLNQIVVVLDPDAIKSALVLTRVLGERAVQVSLPTKPDDAFIEGYLNEASFWKLVRYNGRKNP